MRRILFMTIASAICFAASAQIDQPVKPVADTASGKPLPEFIFSATRAEKDINETPRSTTVITAEQIRNSGANTVAELLSMQEGIYVVGAGQTPGSTSSIFARGANSNQTVIMMDGVRITDPSAINNSIDLSELALMNIERIEIVRGSHSTLFGSSAIGGVVNIITRKAEKPGLSGEAAVTAGSFGENSSLLTENIYLNYALKNGFYFGAELLNMNVQGLNATLDTISDPTVYQHKDLNDDFNKLDYVAKIGFSHKKLDVYASYKQTSQLTDIDKGAYRDDDNYTIDFTRSLATYGAAYKANDRLSLNFTGGYSKMERIAIDDSSKIDELGNSDLTYVKGNFDGTILSNELQANYSVKGFNAVVGASLYSEEMNSNTVLSYFNPFGPPDYVVIETSTDSIKPHASTFSGFLHAELNGTLISDKLSWANLAAGLRISNHSVFGSNTTFEINPSVKLGEGGLLYGLYATGYNAPSLYQLYDATPYLTWDSQYWNGITRGNKKLQPETSQTFEIGYKQQIGNTTLSAAYFNTRVDDAIEYVYLWDQNIGIDTLGQNFGRDDYRGDTYINLGTMHTEGVEISISSRLSEKLHIAAHLSLVNGKLVYDPADIDATQTAGEHVQIYGNGAFITDKEVEALGLTRRPSTANLSLTYMPVKRIALGAQARYAGPRGDVFYDAGLGPYGALGTVAVEQYTLLDLSLRAQIWKGLSANLRVENVLDKKYAEIKGFSTRGRGVYLTLRYML